MRLSAGVVIRYAGFVGILLVLATALLPAQSVTVSPTSLSFGNQVISTASSAKTVTLKNGQSVALTISSIAASGDYSQTNTCGTSLAAGAKCTVSVIFTPSALGPRTGTLTITDGASNSPQTVSLTGTGIAQAALSPATESFGSQAVGTASASKTVTLDNDLPTALSISSIAVSGDYSQTNTCATSVAAAGTCSINIVFSPTTTGSRTGTLTVTDTASNSPQTVSLTGSGILQATVSPSSLSFGNQAVGTSSATKTVTLTNNLGTVLTISSITTSGDYNQTNTCGTSVASGATCTVSVTFTPTTTGTRTGTLTVTDSASNSPQTVSLTGNGVVPVTVSPSTLAFGNQALTTTSGAKTVTVTNKQPTAVTISSITTPTVYAQTNTCGTLLAAQGTCTVSVTFSPTATGSQPGTLTITDNASNSPQAVNLTGTGTALATISKLSVTSSTVGTSVTITGTGFGGSQGSSTVTFNGSIATPTNWKSTSIVVSVPTAATTGNVIVTVNGGASNGVAFTVVPNLTGLSVGTGIAGTSVTITGTGFGPSQGSSVVTFNGTSTVPTTWSATSIAAPVPTGATAGTGSVIVTVSGAASNGATFTVVPNITGLSATSGSIGSSITISGTGFGTTQSSSTVAFNGTPATPTSWSSGAIIVAVPNGATTGTVAVTVGGVASSAVLFTVVPNITNLSASSGIAGTVVTITGTGFGSPQGTSTVAFNGTIASPTNWSTTSITVPVPSAATGGNGTIVVTVGGILSNGAPFAVVPNITNLSATSGAIGSPITITGTGFGSSQGSNTVSFNGTSAVPTNWSSSSITAPVPTGATNGNVVVTVGGVGSSGIAFSVPSGGFVATTGQMTNGLYGQTATQLTSGQVLIAGGLGTSGVLNSAALYNPSSQTFAAASPLNLSRWLHTATLLNDGTVLIAGGSSLSNETTLNSAETYNPTTGTFTLLPSTLNTARVGHTATLLPSGQVLIVGGYDPSTGIIADAELYDPIAQVFIDLGNTNTPRFHHTSTLLQNGQVLITGGETDPTPSGAYNTAEIFNPLTWTFSPVSAQMISGREGHTSTLLNDGTVLIAGGDLPGAGSLNTAEIYTPSANTFTAASATLTSPRIFQDSVLLNGGKVLLMGGESDSGGTSTALNTAELYDPTAQTFNAVSGTMTSVREHQTATLLNDGTVLETGGTDGTNIFNTAEVYTTSKLTGLTSISISPASPSVPLGSQQLLVATGTFSGGGTQVLSSVLWSSSSPSITTASNDESDSGFVASIAQGTSTVAATAAGVSGSTTAMVPAPALLSIAIGPQTVALPLGATQQFDAVGTYSDGSTQDLTSTATWSSSSSSATVTSAGLVTAVTLGSSTIQASFSSQSGSTSVTVGAPGLVSLALTPPAATILTGTTQQYQVTGTYTDGSTHNLTTSVSWSGVPTTTVSVTSSGLATGVGSGTAVISVSSGTVVAVATLAVGGVNPTLVSITVVPNAATVSSGTNQQFSATGTYTDGSTQDLTSSVTWTTSNPTAVGLTSSGLASALSGGTSTITASSGAISGVGSLTVETNSATLNTSRYQHSATLLNNGTVLVTGGITCPSAGSCTYLNSAELYTPSSGTFAATGSMATARSAPAVLLGSGKVLIAGGYSCDSNGNCASLQSAEIYDPASGTFSGGGNMTINRDSHTMTLLNSGQVLIAGGENCTSATSCSALNTAEIYDPVAGAFTATGLLNAARFNASAIALNSGQVLIAGGFNGTSYPAAAEVYNPVGGTFSIAGNLNTPRASATATMLESGNVMIAGGTTCSSPLCPTASVEVYEGGLFTNLSPDNYILQMQDPRVYQTATPLTSGQIFVAGGYNSCNSTNCTPDSTGEIVNANSGWFFASQPLASPRSGHTATLLMDGSVFLIGGINNGISLSSTDSFQPASLDVPGLSTLAISPPNAPVALGTTLQLVATGGTPYVPTEFGILPAVVWNSSSPSVATVTNALGSAGIVNALSLGTTIITASVGSVSTTTKITVTAPLVSITVTPSNPSIPLYSTPQVQFAATGTYADGSSRDLTADATWTSSSGSIAVMLPNQTNPGLAALASVGSTNVTASFGGTSSSTTLTVTPSTLPPPPVQPAITGISPAIGYAGTQVTISGSGFGTSQNSGSVLLGSTLGLIVSWSNTQIVAIVSAGSTSGVAQIQQNGLSSNTLQFTVNPATTITNVFPTNGLPGTQVTISGSGFGATQGSGNVWLGTTPAIVNNWSDGQIIATVGAGAATGNALVLQNGTLSNAVPFTINLPQITGITPNTGSEGTVVTITGVSFGTTQGSGTVLIGSTNGSVIGWSNTQVTASVAANAVSGIVQIQQNGAWSNGITFTVPPTLGSGMSAVTLVPNQINMVVGGTQAIEAVSSTGQSVTGLTWTSSDTAVATLSTDDPPIITAVGVGTSFITAGGAAAAKLTVLAGTTLPTGTVIWSNPGDGTGVSYIVPAVPSSTGVADVFALNADGNVQAITSVGMTAWTANVGTSVGPSNLIPDFQGGLVVASGQSIYRLDGMTGTPSTWTYNSVSGSYLPTPVVHTDGTIFTVDGNAVVGINPTTGSNFSVAMEATTNNGAPVSSPPGPSSIGNLIIAGDGYAYVPYQYSQGSGAETQTVSTGSSTSYLNVLRVGSGGDSSEISVKQWSQSSSSVSTAGGYIPFLTPYSEIIFGAVLNTYCGSLGGCPTEVTETFFSSSSGASGLPSLITNADQGVLLSFQALEGSQSQTTDVYCEAPGCPNEIPSELTSSTSSYNNGVTNNYLATIASGGGVSLATLNLPGPAGPIQPVLQRADGSYVGTANTSAGSLMMAFTASGQQLWSQPNDTPQIATAGGGVIGTSGTTYDQNGNTTGQLASLPTTTYSWKGAYQLGSVESFNALLLELENSYTAVAGGNLTGKGTSLVHHSIGLAWCGTGFAETGSCSGAPFGVGSPDLGFAYTPLPTSESVNDANTLKALSGTWVGTIEVNAMNALRKAFAQFPVIVQLASSHTSLLSTVADQEHIVGVLGGWPTQGQTGELVNLDHSAVYYWPILANAQLAIGNPQGPNCKQSWCGLYPSYPPQTPSDIATFQSLMAALGTGIGNSAAHELGHQFQAGTPTLPFMDCGHDTMRPGGEVACEKGNNYVYNFFSGSGFPQIPTDVDSTGAQFKYVLVPGVPAISWGQAEICALTRQLLDNVNAPCN